MSGSIEVKRGELQAVLRVARDLATKAEKAGRNFTREERVEVERALGKAQKLRDEIDALEGVDRERKNDEALSAAVDEWNQLFMKHRGGGGNLIPSGGRFAAKGSWADAFVKDLQKRDPSAKALMSPSGAVSVPGVISGLTPRNDNDKVETILQLIPTVQLSGTDAFSYLRETVRTHAAAPVADGDLKPTSTYTLERVDDRVRTIAHLTEAIPRHYLDDMGLLRDYLDMVLREGYLLELEAAIISGTGVGEDFTGILNTAGILVQGFTTDVITTARMAVTLLEVQSIAPGGFVFNPNDWETFELTIDGTSGAFTLKNASQALPVDRARRQLWGYPVALSNGITQGTGLLVDFEGSTQLWERQEVRVDWSEAFHVAATAYDANASSGFERNLIKFRAEGRAGFAVKRPRGVVEIDLTAGS